MNLIKQTVMFAFFIRSFSYKMVTTIVVYIRFLIGENDFICYIYVVILTKGVPNHENI